MKKFSLVFCLILFLVACHPSTSQAESYTLDFQKNPYSFENLSIYTYDDQVEKTLLHKASPQEKKQITYLLSFLKEVGPEEALASTPDEETLLLEFAGKDGPAQLFLYDDKPLLEDNLYHYTFYKDKKTRVFTSDKDLIAFIRRVIGKEIRSSYSDCQGHWANKYIAQVEKKALMPEKDSSQFFPNRPLSRADLVQSLYNHAKISSLDLEIKGPKKFTDVSPEDSYKEALDWAVCHNLVAGYPDGAFHGQDPISREELAQILYQYTDLLGNLHQDKKAKAYQDEKDISPWARKAVHVMRLEGYMVGDLNNFFHPQAPISRGEWAKILADL